MAQNDDMVYWYRIDMIPECEQKLFIKMSDELKELIDDQWGVLHNYQNTMRALLGDKYEEYKEDVMTTIKNEDDKYQYFIRKLGCIDNKFKTQQFIPKNFIKHEFLQIAKLFFTPFYDWIEATIDKIFKNEREYGSMWTDNHRINVVFINTLNKEDKIYMDSEKYLRSGIDTTPLIF